MKSVIFDLDLTLVDSSILEQYRKKRDWSTVYSMIPQCYLYNGMEDVFDYIRNNKIITSIVSTSPRPYIERMVSHFKIPTKYIIGYHDAKPIKPHPNPMLMAIKLMNDVCSNTISFGDRSIDIQASNAAKIKSVACTWGSKEMDSLIKSSPSLIIHEPIQIIETIKV